GPTGPTGVPGPTAIAILSSNMTQTVANNAPVNFNLRSSTGIITDATSATIVIPGVYYITWHVALGNDNAGSAQFAITRNNSNAQAMATNQANDQLSGSVVLNLEEFDVIRLINTSGVSKTLSVIVAGANGISARLTIARIL
ncbi:MAG TPA: hypothetical protein DCL31_05215, partial [Clostridium sp.]|nr:hypothetical protein [Clostridium sp.]